MPSKQHALNNGRRSDDTSTNVALLVSVLGANQARRDQFGMRTINAHRNAQDARARATLARAEADELRSLPAGDAARRIEDKRAEQERARRQAAQRARHLHDPFEHEPPRPDPRHDGPALGR